MRTYRCPVDDVVFNTKSEDREPTLEGHPDCPGPVCQENFGGPKVVQRRSVSGEAPATPATPTIAPPPRGQGW